MDFELFQQCQALAEVALALDAAEQVERLEQGDQQGAQGVARPDRPGSDAVDAGIEVIQPDVDALQSASVRTISCAMACRSSLKVTT